MVEADTVGKIGVFPDGFFEFPLGKNDNLKQLVFIGFVIEKLPQDLQDKCRYFLPFIDYKNDCFSLLHAFAEQMLLDILLDLPVGTSGPQLLSRQQLGYGSQKFFSIQEMRIEDEVRFQLLLLAEPADELPAQGFFAGSDVSDDEIEPPAKEQGEL